MYNQFKKVIFIKKSRFRADEAIGNRIRELREKEGLKKNRIVTQEELANELGMPRNTFGRLERGEQALTPEQVGDIIKYFNVSSDWLLFGVGTDYLDFHIDTGLDEKSIKWLENANKNHKEIISIINDLLKDSETAYLFFDCLYVYASADIPQFIRPKDKNWIDLIGIDYFDEEAIFANTISEKLITILQKIRNANQELREQAIEKEVLEALKNIHIGVKKIEEENEEFKQKMLEESL